MKKLLLLTGLMLFVVSCQATATPTPTVTPKPPATATPLPTQAPPTNTPEPPTETAVPTDTQEPPTETPIPETETPLPTATLTRRPVTAAPTATVTATKVALKYQAPVLLEPPAGAVRNNGKEDLLFRWAPVGTLAGNECYLVTVRITNTTDQQYGELSYIAQDTCGDSGNNPMLQFTLNRRPPSPDYQGLVAIASAAAPSNDFVVTWSVIVVQNNGADPNNPSPSQYVPVSPRSGQSTFNLRG